MADPINRLAMFSAPVADDQVNMLAQPQLPPGHPSNMLMWIRDQIPQVQADDSSLASGIYSRLGRTATSIPRAGLETAANWLRGVNDPNAVRIGEDTIAPLGLGAFAGFAGKALAPSRDVRIARDLARRYPDEVAGGEMYYTGGRIGVADGSNRTWGWTEPGHGAEVSNARGGSVRITRPDPEVYGVAHNVNTRGPHAVLSDNAKSSVPGTVVNAMGEQPTTMADLMRLGFGNRDSAEIEWRKRPYDERRAEFEDAIRTHQYKIDEENDIPVPFRYRSLPPSHDDVVRMDSILSLPRKREDVDLSNIWATQGSVDGSAVSNILKRGPDGVDGGEFNAPVAYRALDGSIWLRDGHHRTSAAAARGDPTTEMIVMGSHPIASAPGLAANATQEDNPVLDILSKYGLY